MASLAHRLKLVQTTVEEPGPDFSHMSIHDLENCKVDFGTKHAGENYLHVWTNDQPWVMWMVQHYSTSKKFSHRQFLHFVELKIERAELEGTGVPVIEPNLEVPKTSSQPKGHGKSSVIKAKAKAKTQAYPSQGHVDPLQLEFDEFEEESFEVLNPLETEKDAEIQCLQNRMLNIENALQQVIQHLGAQKPIQES